MPHNRWLKFITNNGVIDVQEEIPGLIFLGARESPPNPITNNIQIQGIDGELPGLINYGPFELIVSIGLDGYDVEDVELAEQKIRGVFNTKGRYYVIHSNSPGKKYAVDPPNIGTPEFLDSTALIFEITFTVYKGYSESLYDTDNYNLSDGLWQFESGVLPDSSISYEHTRQRFDILNGSNDTINPRLRHKLKIYMRLDAPNGFKLINTTTGDVFHYKVALDSNDRLLIDGAYPWLLHDLQDKRCGRNTNHGVITLAPGINKFEIWGNVSNTQTKFTFPFIYR
ncbi:phage tail domain-containing protein [Mammaliicoccus sciuri]|uniref:phage tail domain-containing protein n=1 Tax=Mammaliicoccus sciuri TaxID=1296 RepID=UPI002DB6EFB4|nr:phage tail domain-containing protein [Mammaliicoccus sciuri]MEB6231387.1 phage tail family protein [Mammaliicoccus sciuri]